MTQINKFKAALARIHREEEGMEALQTVLILAIAAIVLAFAYKIFGGGSDNTTETAGGDTTIAGWVIKVVNNVTGWK